MIKTLIKIKPFFGSFILVPIKFPIPIENKMVVKIKAILEKR